MIPFLLSIRLYCIRKLFEGKNHKVKTRRIMEWMGREKEEKSWGGERKHHSRIRKYLPFAREFIRRKAPTVSEKAKFLGEGKLCFPHCGSNQYSIARMWERESRRLFHFLAPELLFSHIAVLLFRLCLMWPQKSRIESRIRTQARFELHTFFATGWEKEQLWGRCWGWQNVILCDMEHEMRFDVLRECEVIFCCWVCWMSLNRPGNTATMNGIYDIFAELIRAWKMPPTHINKLIPSALINLSVMSAFIIDWARSENRFSQWDWIFDITRAPPFLLAELSFSLSSQHSTLVESTPSTNRSRMLPWLWKFERIESSREREKHFFTSTLAGIKIY